MYKCKKQLFSILAFLVAMVATAKPVDPALAARIAAQLLHKQVVDATPASYAECFLFVGADGTGFALIAADDCVRPILGYSLTGVFPAEKLPPHIGDWIDNYRLQIAACRDLGVTPSDIASREWSLKFNTLRDTAVGPLMSTTWSQRPWYNDQCPVSSEESGRAVTGCVATATAQVMKYWNHPAVGRGSHSYTPANFDPQSANFDTTHYDWSHMPDALGWNSTEEEIAAVAQLMHHVGIAIDMKYGVNASSATIVGGGSANKPSSENALKNYFRYNQALFSAGRVDYSNEVWDSLLTNELNASRPVLYCGNDDDGGHAFVLDGYDSLGLFHVNWGWGGFCDGFYAFDNLSPTGSGIGGNPSNAYNKECKALLHVFPASENPTVSVNIVNANPDMGTITGGGTFPCYTPTTIFASAPEGYRFLTWKSGNHENPFDISPNHDYTDTALFGPIYGDTLGYCFSTLLDLWGEYAGYSNEWGIRIPASSIPAHRQLNAIQIHGVEGAEFTIKVYLGANFDRMIFSTTYTTPHFEWYTVPLSTGIPLIDDQPLWIVLNSNSYSNPAIFSFYSGNPDGCWYKRAGTTWERLVDRNEYKSWMIRGILGELEQVAIAVEPSHPDRGTVDGSGMYYPGDTAILTATPAAGYRFAGWSTGDRGNPLQYRVTIPETLIATFVPAVGIDESEDNSMEYSLKGLSLTVNNPSAEQLSLYDIQGRLLSTSQLPVFNYQFSGPGVFILRSGSIAKKIIVQ